MRIDSIFQTLAFAVTLTFVFVIRHTQTQERVVTQRKVDEILRALPHADDALIGWRRRPTPSRLRSMLSHRELRAEAFRPTDE